MSIHITKRGIRATGERDASGILIAMALDEQIVKWFTEKTGSESFAKMVEEAAAFRRLMLPGQIRCQFCYTPSFQKDWIKEDTFSIN